MHLEFTFAGRFRRRGQLIRRLLIVLAIILVIFCSQMFIFYSTVVPLFGNAEENFRNLVAERNTSNLAKHVLELINEMGRLSEAETWQNDIETIANEFQKFLVTPASGVSRTLNLVVSVKNQSMTGRDIVERMEQELIQIEDLYHDYYGEIESAISQPDIHLWPTSILIKWIYGGTLLDTVHFNRSLYLITLGEGQAAQAILGELRTRIPDSPLRANVLYTEGRLLYGMGRYEESIEMIQDSIRIDPTASLAKRFLEYQLSKGPDKEIEKTDEDVQRSGFTSGAGGTLF